MVRLHWARPALAVALVTLLVPAAGSGQGSGSTIPTEQVFHTLGIGEGQTVCEIGAGDGELSVAAARLVGPRGHVYTSELGDSRVRSLGEKVAASGFGQITVVAGDRAKTNFPNDTCDALFMRNVYHHFEDPVAMGRAMVASVKPGGRVAVVDFTPPGTEAARPEDRDRDGMHGVTAASVEREMTEAGLEMVSSESGDGRWFMVVLSKPKG